MIASACQIAFFSLLLKFHHSWLKLGKDAEEKLLLFPCKTQPICIYNIRNEIGTYLAY